MEKEIVQTKLSFLKHSITQFFDIDESFVDISETKKTGKEMSYQFEIKIEMPAMDLRTIHLSVYYLNVILVDSDKFIYETNYYIYNELNSFLEK